MHSRKYLKASVAIIVAFAVGLVFFFIFSAPYGDGLEKTMENAGVQEPEPVYHAPFEYGGNYPAAFIMGVLGFVVVLGSVYLLGQLIGKNAK
jgi:hypothetical protein